MSLESSFLRLLGLERRKGGGGMGLHDLLPYLVWGGLGYIPPSGGLALGRVSGLLPLPLPGLGVTGIIKMLFGII